MRHAGTRQLACMLLLTVGALALAQELKLPDGPEKLHIALPPSDRFPANWYPRVGDGTDVVPAPVLGLPYTATVETITPYQGLAGESLKQITHGFQARDRLGRTRIESINGSRTMVGHSVQTKAIIVADPVSHCQFTGCNSRLNWRCKKICVSRL